MKLPRLATIWGISLAIFGSIFSAGIAPASAATEPFETLRSNIAAITYYGGHPGGESYDYASLIPTTADAIEEASEFRGYLDPQSKPNIDYRIAYSRTINAPPPQLGIECEQYLSEVHNGTWSQSDWEMTSCWGSGTADYQEILASEGLCELANQGKIDEVWLFGFGNGGFWESNMAGPTSGSDPAYWTNGDEVPGTSCAKSIHIMGFNYELAVDYAMHSFGHRMESIFRRFGRPVLGDTSAYDSFSSETSCGDVHHPPNTETDYEYDSTTVTSSNCEAWNWDTPGASEDFNCSRWDCTHLGYLTWWFQGIPGAFAGLSGASENPARNLWSYFLFSARAPSTARQRPKNLYRFYSQLYKSHFYTASEAEKNYLIANDANWQFEGRAYGVSGLVTDSCGLPYQQTVFRFWHPTNRRHFYTLSISERDQIIAGSVWQYEGPKFCTYKHNYEGTAGVFRFYSQLYRSHFYTNNTVERDNLINFGGNWSYEGVGYYAPQ